MLFVFDLDFTIWNCGGTWCDHTDPPYKMHSNNTLTDSEERLISLYPDSLSILQRLQNQQIPIAIASRTSAPYWAKQLLDLFDIDSYFKFREIYPGSKINHFRSLYTKTGIAFNEMFFFDDEYRNIEDVKSLGVNCIFVENGITKNHINKALKKIG